MVYHLHYNGDHVKGITQYENDLFPDISDLLLQLEDTATDYRIE